MGVGLRVFEAIDSLDGVMFVLEFISMPTFRLLRGIHALFKTLPPSLLNRGRLSLLVMCCGGHRLQNLVVLMEHRLFQLLSLAALPQSLQNLSERSARLWRRYSRAWSVEQVTAPRRWRSSGIGSLQRMQNVSMA